MKRYVCIVLALMLCAAICLPVQAAARLDTYTLVVDGEPVKLDEKTGLLYRSGSAMMVPVKAISEALGYDCEMIGTSAELTGLNSRELTIRPGTKKALLNTGKYKKLRVKTVLKNDIMLSDINVFKLLGAKFKNYSAAAAKKKGYSGGVLVMDSTGEGSVSLPDINAQAGDELPKEAAQAANQCDQIITVEYNTNTKTALLSFYQKNNGKWYRQFSPVTAYIGKNGLGKTMEGDGKTPAGTFDLKQPFGILADPGTSLGDYVKVNARHYWCSNPASKYYNRLVDIGKTDYQPVKADEHLIGIKPQYNYCIQIDYNSACVPGKGSAIFLHCKGSAKTTGGCVAVSQAVMKELLLKLKPGAKIVIF